MKPSQKTPRRNAGFSLVEVMVAVVIGMIGTLIMFQVFATSEAQKRTTVSGGDSQQNGAIALYTIEQDVRNGAAGERALIAQAQPLYIWNEDLSAVQPTVYFLPTLITPGAGSDAIEVNYSTNQGLTVPIPLLNSWSSTASPINTMPLITVAGIENGDQLAICPNLTAQPNSVCIMGEVAGVAAGNAITFSAPPTTYVDNDGQVRSVKNNPSNGFSSQLSPAVEAGLSLPGTFSADGTANGAVAYNLGRFVTRIYDVQNNQLRLTDNGTTTEFADGVVSLRAQYGLDTNADNSVDVWVDPRGVQPLPPASFTPDHPSFLIGTRQQIATSWAMVKAIRVAVVTRSGNFEKDIVEPNPTIPLWTNPTGNPVPGPSFTVPAGDAQHYRYKAFESIVPVRNMILRPLT